MFYQFVVRSWKHLSFFHCLEPMDACSLHTLMDLVVSVIIVFMRPMTGLILTQLSSPRALNFFPAERDRGEQPRTSARKKINNLLCIFSTCSFKIQLKPGGVGFPLESQVFWAKIDLFWGNFPVETNSLPLNKSSLGRGRKKKLRSALAAANKQLPRVFYACCASN